MKIAKIKMEIRANEARENKMDSKNIKELEKIFGLIDKASYKNDYILYTITDRRIRVYLLSLGYELLFENNFLNTKKDISREFIIWNNKESLLEELEKEKSKKKE